MHFVLTGLRKDGSQGKARIIFRILEAGKRNNQKGYSVPSYSLDCSQLLSENIEDCLPDERDPNSTISMFTDKSDAMSFIKDINDIDGIVYTCLINKQEENKDYNQILYLG
ncbi:hypothetical protein KY366_08690 [Candidatus Woesearchaeota archaeon]|nr:hypothetical protein [Candidatus Woesearchaeota archaeon]